MKDFALEVPINQVSFGNVSIAILREIHKKGLFPNVFPIQPITHREALDGFMNAQTPDKEFADWLWNCISKASKDHCRKNTSVRLWHINGSLQSYSESDSRLITFHELDTLTPTEINILKNQDRIYVTSSFSKRIFSEYGVESTYLPLGFDSHNFKILEKRPKVEGVTSWGIAGKFEIRKNHHKILNLWAKKYGNNKDHRLNLAIFNPFLKPEHTQSLINQALEGKQYWNIGPRQPDGTIGLPYMVTNAEYNQFLQTNDVYIALSGGEGRDLPAFHSAALGAHVIALKAHAYLDYFNESNAILVNPNGKRPAADGIFFIPNSTFNNGNFFDFSDQDFSNACDEAEKRVVGGINTAGLELQKNTYAETMDCLLKD